MSEISQNKMVTLHYRLRENDINGKVLEDTYSGAPLTFKFGVGQMIPGFEAKINSKSEGDNFDFTLEPGEAYGDLNYKSIVEIPKKNFSNANGEIDPNVVGIGLPVRMKNQNGQPFTGIIKEISEMMIKVDFNHPMAGKRLHFTVEILEVKDDLGLI